MRNATHPEAGPVWQPRPAAVPCASLALQCGYIFSPAAIGAIDAYRQMPERHGAVEHQFNDPGG